MDFGESGKNSIEIGKSPKVEETMLRIDAKIISQIG
jgi:hypothetical protein